MLFLLPLVFSGDPFHYERPERPSDLDFWDIFKELVGFVSFIIGLAAFVRNPLLTLSHFSPSPSQAG